MNGMIDRNTAASKEQLIFEIGRGLASAEIDAMYHKYDGTLKAVKKAQNALKQLERMLS